MKLLSLIFVALVVACAAARRIHRQQVLLNKTQADATNRFKKVLLMSDVDDTLTCPAKREGSFSLTHVKASLAGSDDCPDMVHGQIYYGVGLFLHLLGTRGGATPEFVIVSANPFAGKKNYKYINDYVQKVSGKCKTKYNSGEATLSLNHVMKGSKRWSTWSSISGHYKHMGKVKLKQLVQRAKQSQPDRIVWLGDTGQGDVCTAVCFLSPEECPLEIPDETNQDLRDLQHVEKYAFLHYIAEPETDMLTECFNVAKTHKNIYFFGEPGSSTRRWDYASMISKLCSDPLQDLMDCPPAGPDKLEDYGDCLDDSDQTVYLKHH